MGERGNQPAKIKSREKAERAGVDLDRKSAYLALIRAYVRRKTQGQIEREKGRSV